MLQRLYRWLMDWLGFSIPADVYEGMPTSLDEYRRRRRIHEINAEQVAERLRRGPVLHKHERD